MKKLNEFSIKQVEKEQKKVEREIKNQKLIREQYQREFNKVDTNNDKKLNLKELSARYSSKKA